MHYVCLPRSHSHPEQRYIGSTSDLKNRLREHNAGESIHRAKFIPWQIEAYLAFQAEETAAAFEKYLKSGSGRAFAKRHLRRRCSAG